MPLDRPGQHHDQAPSPGPAPGSAAHARSPPPGSPPAGRTAPSSVSTSASTSANNDSGLAVRSCAQAISSRTQATAVLFTRPFPLSAYLVGPLIRQIRCGLRITRLLRTVSGACCRQGGGGAADRTSAKGGESNPSTQQALRGGAHEASPLNLQIERSLTPAPVTSQQQHRRGAPRV
jgi:hypothetical protein